MPNLRFPEFRDNPGWQRKRLGALGTFTRGLTYSADDVAELGLLVLRSGNIQGGRLVLEFGLVYVDKECPADLLLRDGDIAICMSNGSKALVGKSAEYRGGHPGDVTVGAFCSIFRASIEFAKIVFATRGYADFVAHGIAGGNINNLKNSDLEALEFPIPGDGAEQQKIADCLGSLDNLIVAEGRKLEVLRQHKQGLMQQLFPQPGETVPRIRFPEFREGVEWNERPLSQLLTFQSGFPFSSSNFGGEKQGFRLIRNRDLRSDDRVVYYDGQSSPDFIVNEGDLLVGMDGDFTPCVWRRGTGLLNQRVGRVLPRGEHVLTFLGYLLEIHLKVVQEDTGRTTVKHLSSKQVEGLVAHVPDPAEQQRIADALAAVDVCIDGQAAKYGLLKMHKQGLLQQLFPSPDEAAQ